jgi:hypothetical protein
VKQIEEQLLHLILGMEQGAFLVAGGMKAEVYAVKRAVGGMAAVVATYPGYAL